VRIRFPGAFGIVLNGNSGPILGIAV
jgi:hypothetical protein